MYRPSTRAGRVVFLFIALGAACAGSSPPAGGGDTGRGGAGGDESGAGGGTAGVGGGTAGTGGGAHAGTGGGGDGGQAPTPDASAPEPDAAQIDAAPDAGSPPVDVQAPAADAVSPAGAIVWHIDNTTSIAGHPTKALGAPMVIDTPAGKALQFDGQADALMVENDPVAGLAQFTAELIFRPDADGAYEQRVFHMSHPPEDSRVLFETRVMNGKFFLDVVLVSGGSSVLLYNENMLNPAGVWHAVGVAFDGTRARTYVDGVEQFTGTIQWKPLGPGRTAVGMRINAKSFFKGAMRLFRITPRALTPAELLKADDQL